MNFGAAFAIILSRGLVLVAGLATGIITARILGPDGRGQYFAVTTLSAIVAQLGNLGLTSSNVFLAARDREAVGPLLVNGAWLSVALAVISALVMISVGSTISARLEVPDHVLWAVCLLGPAALFFTLLCSLLVAEERFTALNRWQNANAILTLALLAAAATVGSSVEWFVSATTLASVFTAMALCAFVASGRSRQLAFNTGMFVAGWKFSSRAYVVLLLGFLMQRASVAILMIYGGPLQIGLYSIASQVFDVLVIVPSSMAMVIFPSLVKDSENPWTSTRQALVVTLALMLILCAGMALLARPLIQLAFGAEFVPAYTAVLFILPCVMFTSATSVLSQLVVSKRFPISLIAMWAAGLLTMCLVAAFLAGPHGAAGVAAAQSVGSALVCIGVVVLARRQLASRQ